MQTLLFNTTLKFVKLYTGHSAEGDLILQIENVPTVKVLDGFYEVMQKDEFEKNYPVLRVGIQSTNMIISK